MDSKTLQRELIKATKALCGHEERKGQLSMSWLHLREEEILERVKNGCYASDELKMKYFQGTWSEKGLICRLESLEDIKIIGRQVEVTAFKGRLTGHADVVIEGQEIIEYKTVPTNEMLEEMKRKQVVGIRTFSQVQAYLLWGNYSKAYIIIESREGGFPWVVEMYPDKNRQRELHEKAERVLRMMDKN